MLTKTISKSITEVVLHNICSIYMAIFVFISCFCCLF